MINVLIVDDNAEVRGALKRLIEKTTDIKIVGEAASGQDAVDNFEKLDCDVILLDVSLPDFSGLEVLKRIISRRPNVRVIIVSVHSEELYAGPARRLGAWGYVTKDKAAAHLVTAIRSVSKGSTYFNPSLAEHLDIPIDKRPTPIPGFIEANGAVSSAGEASGSDDTNPHCR
jgi:DNA-binding NarL/FixJ family response regulator